MSLPFHTLARISKGVVLSNASVQNIDYLVTDSRTLNIVKGAVFFAIKGKNQDGHRYLKELYLIGVRQFVIEDLDKIDPEFLIDSNVFHADEVIETLQDIAAHHRNHFGLQVIGITGSNGKTIVKEWLNQLLSPGFKIVKSPKSYNSQIGVPHSVWQINESHDFGIFEAGISRPNEMANLERLIQPSIGIFTNIGPAHAEGFDCVGDKIAEKSKLFLNCDFIFYNKGFREIDTYLKSNFPLQKLIGWSLVDESEFKVTINKTTPGSISLTILFQSDSFDFKIPFRDDASIENAIHCIMVMIHYQIPVLEIQKRLFMLNNIPMRLELKEGRNNSYIIDDTYNNDQEGLKIALQFMQQQNLKNNKVVILSDMLETGKDNKVLYREVAELLKKNNVSLFIGIGPGISDQRCYYPENSRFYTSTEYFLEDLSQISMNESLILVKGARIFKFERIVQAVTYKIHRTVLEINLNALSHNLNVFRQMVRPNTKMMVMVKAFAYGSGSHEVAHLLQYHKVDYLAVAYTDEGIALRENNIRVPIMVMNPAPDEFEKIVKYNLEPEIYNFRLLNEYSEYVKRLDIAQVPPLHIAIDTGMHRLGFESHHIDELCQKLREGTTKVASIFSHLVGADEEEHDHFSYEQGDKFIKIARRVETELGYPVIKHILNSAGITRMSDLQFDMVRLGIGLYGIEALNHPQNLKLENVSTLKTVISQIKNIPKGESVGYSRKGFAREDIKIATVAIGYGDGYSRKFSNGVGKMFLKGQLVPVIGNVCMDMCMIDITGVDAEEGEEVILFGKELRVIDLAASTGTISYEILTNVSERVKRIFYLD